MDLLLLTGATGFLGGAVLDKLMNNQKNIELLLLVRADSQHTGLERVKDNGRKFNICEDRLHSLTIDNILLGDLNNPETFLYDPRLDKVTYVINCAAVASFGNNPLIWSVNVTGTLAFAKRMTKVTGLKRFIHVGTAMSCTPNANSSVTEDAAALDTGRAFGRIYALKSNNRTFDAQRMSQLALIDCPSIHYCRPHPFRVLTFNQYFLGVQNGINVTKIYVFTG